MIELDTIYNEDCLETLSKMDDNTIDLIVTSPPYDNLRTYRTENNDGCVWNYDVFKPIASELFRVVKPGGVVVWVVGDATIKGSETGSSFRQALYFMELGFNLNDTMIWTKNTIPSDPKCNRYWQGFEYMFVFSKGKPKTCNYITERCKNAGKAKKNDYGQKRKDGTNREDRWDESRKIKDEKVKTNVWHFNPDVNNKTGHPAVFPYQLAYDHIRSWSNEGDIVYDPFMGSGTVAKAARDLNRHYIGSELNPDYIIMTEERLGLI